MVEPTVTISRSRYETLIRQALAAGETINALMSALKAEVPDPQDPRGGTNGEKAKPATFRSGSTT